MFTSPPFVMRKVARSVQPAMTSSASATVTRDHKVADELSWQLDEIHDDPVEEVAQVGEAVVDEHQLSVVS